MRIKKKLLENLIKEFLLEEEDEVSESSNLEDLVVIGPNDQIYTVSMEPEGGINLTVGKDKIPYKSDDSEDIREKIAAVVSKAYTSVVDGTANLEQQNLIKSWVEKTIEGGLEKVANSKTRLSVVFDAMVDASEGKNKIS